MKHTPPMDNNIIYALRNALALDVELSRHNVSTNDQTTTAHERRGESDYQLDDVELDKQLALMDRGFFRLVVVGEVKRGKSSLINAMLGYDELVPTGDLSTTSTIFKIHYGAEVGYRVHFLKNSGKSILDIDKDHLCQYGTEAGNPRNFEQVDFIEVSCPSPFLQNSGIVIIDTPGLGSINQFHKEITYQYVPRADAVLFVTDSYQGAVSELEIQYLDDIRRITPHIYFVQTKAYTVNKAARNERKEYNLDVFSRFLKIPKREVPYFVVDSTLRFLAEKTENEHKLDACGIPKLMAYFTNELMPKRRKLLATRALIHMQPVLIRIQKTLSEEDAILHADTTEKIDQLSKDIDNKRKELQDWEIYVKPTIEKEIKQKTEEIELRASRHLQSSFHINSFPDNSGKEVVSIMEARSEKELELAIAAIRETFPGNVQKIARNVWEEIRSEVSILLKRQAEIKEINLKEMETVLSYDPESIYRLHFDRNDEETIRFLGMKWNIPGAINGLGTGISLSGLVTQSISSLVAQSAFAILASPVTIAASLVGLPLICSWAVSSIERRIKGIKELKKVKEAAVEALSSDLRKIYEDLNREFRHKINGVQEYVNKEVEIYLMKEKERMEKERSEVENRGRLETDEKLRRQRDLLKRRQAFDEIMTQIEAFQKDS